MKLLSKLFVFVNFQWTQLNNRKANLTRLLQKMQTFQYEQISADPDKPLGDTRALTDADIERWLFLSAVLSIF